MENLLFLQNLLLQQYFNSFVPTSIVIKKSNQLTFACSKSTTETLEKDMEYV